MSPPRGAAQTVTEVGVDSLTELGATYRLEVDTMVCRSCKRRQQVSWRDHAFPHAAGCKRREADPHPWGTLVYLTNAAPKSLVTPAQPAAGEEGEHG